VRGVRFGFVTADNTIVGWYIFAFGILLWLPATGRFFKRASDFEFRLMPWLNKLPWMPLARSRTYQTFIRLLVGTGFIVFGLLTAVGVIHPN
jgi:hypothetical protein